MLAPSHRDRIAIATFIVGTIVAAVMGVMAEAFAPMLTAIFAGALTLWILLRRPGSVSIRRS